MTQIKAFLARIQLAHAFTSAAVIFTALAATYGINTRDGIICAIFAAVHLGLSFVETAKVPAWLSKSASEVDWALDNAVGVVPVLTVLRAALVARGASVSVINALDELISIAPYAGVTTFTPVGTGTPTTSGGALVLSVPHMTATELAEFREIWRRAEAPCQPYTVVEAAPKPPPPAAHA